MLVEDDPDKDAQRDFGCEAVSPRKVLFSAMKNEAPFILEWVAYHLEIGFEHIIIFSNESDDGTTELLDALAASGVIEHHTHVPPKGVSAQINAARIANENALLNHGDWVLWIDADEFLNVKVGNGKLDDLIEVIGERHGMLINWRIFGDSGNVYFPGRFISSRFFRASKELHRSNLEVKTFFQHGPNIAGLAVEGIHRPTINSGMTIGADSFLNGNGHIAEATENHKRWLAGADSWRSCRVSVADAGGSVAQINHYCVRTPEMFALKRSRGRGWAADQQGASNERHSDRFYQRMNRNGRIDRSILRYKAAVDERLRRLEALPGVYAAQNAGRRRTAIAIAHNTLPDAKPSLADVLSSENVELPMVTLPARERQVVEEYYQRADKVLEYGSGGSTAVALKAGVKHLYSVESDPVWAEHTIKTLRRNFPGLDFVIHFEDIGPTIDWGRPHSDMYWEQYHRYATSVWDLPHFVQPDVILIDGRFRTACFCTALMKIANPLTILFDDYLDRPEYHWVEELLPRVETIGRLARFEVKEKIDVSPFLTQIAGSFSDAR